jgi:CRP-like cAMP-binding protein
MLEIPPTATVRALEDTVVFVINNQEFKKLLQEQPNLSERIIQELKKHQ